MPRTKHQMERPRRKKAVRSDSPPEDVEMAEDEGVPSTAPSSSRQPSRRPARAPAGYSSPPNCHGIFFRDEHQEARYHILAGRELINTRYMHLETVQSLGFEDDITWMCSNISWEQFALLTPPTYTKITLEFLSSLNPPAAVGDGLGAGGGGANGYRGGTGVGVQRGRGGSNKKLV